MKNYFALLLALCLMGCTPKKEPIINTTESVTDSIPVVTPEATIDPKLLIIPGTSIGLTVLGQNAATLAKLGQPDLSDAAMGKAWLSWYSKKADANGFRPELMVSTGYKDSTMAEKVIKEIRINSADFRTAKNNGVGQPRTLLLQEFPELKKTSSYTIVATQSEVQLYDSVAQGIAFEIANDSCIAVLVHLKNRPSGNEYLALHPELQRQ